MAESKLDRLGKVIDELDARIAELRRLVDDGGDAYRQELADLEQRSEQLATELCSDLSSWDRVTLARHQRRPQSLDYIDSIVDDFVELHGDRRFGDDRAMITGLGFLDGRPIAVVAQQKGRTTQERREHNFGMSHPEGYRKAMRVMQLAARMGRSIITLIDTPGADCLADSESRGISEAIATNQRDMFSLPVPVVCTVIGEGGSGGAIGIGAGDTVMMFEHAYYSVITPEGCAAILWHDPSLREEAAAALKLTAPDAVALGVVDRVVPEPPGGAHRSPAAAAANLKQALKEELDALAERKQDALLQARYEKYRRMGMPEGLSPAI